MVYKYSRDEWNADGLRDRLFGERKTIRARYSSEFVREYLSHDEGSDFNLKKSHNTLTLTSSEEFAFLNSKEMNGICDRVYHGKRNGTYFAVYHFKNPPDEFFIANDMLNEIAKINNAKISHNYEFPDDLPQTTSSGRTLSSCVSILDSEDIYFYDTAAENKKKLIMLSKKPFRFPRGIGGYDVKVKRGIVESNKNLFALTYLLPLEVADVLEEPIIKEIASTN